MPLQQSACVDVLLQVHGGQTMHVGTGAAAHLHKQASRGRAYSSANNTHGVMHLQLQNHSILQLADDTHGVLCNTPLPV